ncbi:GntR family transcriptional regulator [Streptomyces violascens]|uniref:GntR family transcriptional regulator n=1 Tax=Streptomyces violascens TaxID=67381 RepID=UPI003696C5AC
MTALRKASPARLADTCHVLLRQIARGDRPPGHRLPAPIALAHELGVSEIVLRSALDDLTKERVLRRSRAARYTVAAEEDWRITLPVLRGKALAVTRQLRSELRTGAYDDGGELPTAYDLAGRHRATVDEVRVALRELAAEGLIALPPLQKPLVRYEAERSAPPTSPGRHA